ncbi:sensor histidine kinase [Spirillospora sp. CA-294931]|uniref:sensor histidine kinase n=1 Tax=Spirillospora sp. CA-294931 TaxID=3240042 RepID=UPI003D932EFA
MPRLSSIRTRISVLILVPLLSLVALWVFVTIVSFGDVNQLRQGGMFREKAVEPSHELLDGLQKERRLSLAHLGGVPTADRAALDAQRRSTDAARETVRRNSRDAGLRRLVRPVVRQRLDDLVGHIAALDGVRRTVDQRGVDRARVLQEYSGIIDAGFAFYNVITPRNGHVTSDVRLNTSLARAREYLSREDALLTGALGTGRLTAFERGQFTQLVGAQRYQFSDAAPSLGGDDLAQYQRLVASSEFIRLRMLEDRTMRSVERPVPAHRPGKDRGAQANRVPSNAAPVDAAAWRAAVDSVGGRLLAFERNVAVGTSERAEGIARDLLLRLLLAGGLGLLAIVLSAFIGVRLARGLLRECRTLAARVVDFTQRRLPLLSAQVRDGRPISPGDDDPEGRYRIDEIRQISESFTRAREAVIEAAAGELAARNGLSEVFVNLARRSQALLHRQLGLLDAMERRTEDPAELGDLFRLDHLATRMRRHAEGLVILAGRPAGRGWRRPVPAVDVVRGAVAEVEDYPRVRVAPLPRLAVHGAAVADLIHLLAEIVENATAFSPPGSPVRVSGHEVGHGFALEIEDRGLGMTDEELGAANRRLADPPDFDPSDSARLGLFVVARLARRHGVTVTLRRSPYGGTTAIALIPGSLVTDLPEPEPAGIRLVTGPQRALAPAREGTAPAASSGSVRLVAEPEPEPEPEAPPAPEPDGDLGGLPRRRRQTHLAPQLAAKVDADMAAAEGTAAEPDGDEARTPENMASKISTMQRGWQRGRGEAEQSQHENREEGDDTP